MKVYKLLSHSYQSMILTRRELKLKDIFNVTRLSLKRKIRI